MLHVGDCPVGILGPKREKRGEEKGRKGRERKVVWDHTIIYGHR